MKALQLTFGLILLFPGLCSLYFMLSGMFVPIIVVPCLAVSAFGVWLLYRAGQPK